MAFRDPLSRRRHSQTAIIRARHPRRDCKLNKIQCLSMTKAAKNRDRVSRICYIRDARARVCGINTRALNDNARGNRWATGIWNLSLHNYKKKATRDVAT